MNERQFKVGNVVLEIPDLPGLAMKKKKSPAELVAGRGYEAQPIVDEPVIPDPNEFLYAICRVGTSDKSWVNITGGFWFLASSL